MPAQPTAAGKKAQQPTTTQHKKGDLRNEAGTAAYSQFWNKDRDGMKDSEEDRLNRLGSYKEVVNGEWEGLFASLVEDMWRRQSEVNEEWREI